MKNLQNLRVIFLAGILGPGGAERQLFYILKTLKYAHADISLITFSKGQFWENPIRKLEIPIIKINGKNKFHRLKSLISHVKKINPVFIQSQHFYTNLYAALSARISGALDIGAIRSNGFYEVKNTGVILGLLSLHAPKYLAANSGEGKDFAESAGIPARRLRLLPNVVDTHLFTPAEKDPSNHSITLLMVSNLRFREKRVELFIQSIGRLQKMTKTFISARIVGDGPLRSELERLALEQELAPGQIQFLGNHDHVEDIYRDSDLLVLTSDREGTPNVIMEAMASGLPVVATSVGGVPDLVRDGETGYLVPPGDLNGLVDKLAALVENPNLRIRMGQAGREVILAHHSLERMPDILSEFYASIL
jgi:glycosyltransferase involved in cell wall biosynthesis